MIKKEHPSAPEVNKGKEIKYKNCKSLGKTKPCRSHFKTKPQNSILLSNQKLQPNSPHLPHFTPKPITQKPNLSLPGTSSSSQPSTSNPQAQPIKPNHLPHINTTKLKSIPTSNTKPQAQIHHYQSSHHQSTYQTFC